MDFQREYLARPGVAAALANPAPLEELDADDFDVVFVPVIVAGANATVMPGCTLVDVNATSPVNPPTRAMVMPVVEFAPIGMLRVVGDSARVKPGGAVIVSAMVVVRSVCPVAAPRTVRLYVPGTTAPVVVMESVEVPAVEVAGFGVKVPATPVGAPSRPRVTLPVKPPVLVIVTV